MDDIPTQTNAQTQPAVRVAAPSLVVPGDVVAGRWHVVRALGSGGAGSVHEARDALTGRRVALKSFHPGEASSPGRVRREIAALRLLRVPGVVQLLEDTEDRGHRVLVMEYVDGAPFPGRDVPAPWGFATTHQPA